MRVSRCATRSLPLVGVAQLAQPRAATWYGTDGAFAIADGTNQIIRIVWPNGTISRVTGAPATAGAIADCTANAARFNGPEGIAFHPGTGRLW
jgi:hypothetical protein